MMRRFNLSQLIFSVSIVLLMSFFISCGGGGDDGSSSKSRISLDGDYGMVIYESIPGTEEGTTFGTATFTDGSENVIFEQLYTSEGNLGTVGITYTAYSDGTMTVIGSEGEVSRGIVSPDENVCTFVNTDFDDDDVEIGFGIKKSSGMTNADLTGEYVFVSYYNNPWTAYGTITFNGDGTAIYQRLDDSDGGDMPDPESINYNVSDDGSLTITVATTEVSHGMVSPDGSILAVANTDTSALLDPSIGIDVAIKKSSGMSNAVAAGDYIGVNYHRETSSTYVSTTYGLLEFDVDGLGVIEQIYTSESFLDTLLVENDVSPDGTTIAIMTDLSLVPQGLFFGIISSNGDVGASVDTDDDDHIGIIFSIRKH